MAGPQISWDLGTAYDLFLSLYVLHHADKFGLRASWAAGVRSRLPTDDRKTLEEATQMFGAPLHWVHSLPKPKDSAAVIWSLRRLKPEDRLPALTYEDGVSAETREFLDRISERGAWDESDLERLKEMWSDGGKHSPKRDELTAVLNGWANRVEFGERYLAAIQSYVQVFYAEEEIHVASRIQSTLENAQKLAAELPPDLLIERLSQGLQIPHFLTMDELIFVPSFWMTPLIYMAQLAPKCTLIAFGARSPTESLIPGEDVPDLLLQALKALADPTRLRIMNYLAQEPLTPAELARRLRLRAPTVTHHLSSLRLAGLVSISINENDERRYTARLEAVQGLSGQIMAFIQGAK